MTTQRRYLVKRRRSQRGFALITVILGFSLVLLTLLVASTLAQLGSRLVTLQLAYQGQALNTANSGLIEGLDYFRRQASQPVAAFNPQRNLAASPPIDDTDDAVTSPLAIRRDFLISSPGRVWGHYELLPGTAGNGSTGVIDLSTNRLGSAAAAGGIWQLESTGIIYVSGGPVLAKRTVRSEISRLQFTPPAAAISIYTGTLATITTKARVVGGTSAGVLATVLSPLTPTSPSVLSGTPTSATGNAASTLSLSSVFGGTITKLSDLVQVADVAVTTEASVPNPVQMQIVYLNKGAAAAFDSATPLKGSGVLVVNGNLTLSGNSNWNGIIYVLGNYTQNAPAQVAGAIVVAGAIPPSATATALITSSGADFADVYYDPTMINQIRKQLGQYRFSRSGYIPCPVTDPLCQKRTSGNREVAY